MAGKRTTAAPPAPPKQAANGFDSITGSSVLLQRTRHMIIYRPCAPYIYLELHGCMEKAIIGVHIVDVCRAKRVFCNSFS